MSHPSLQIRIRWALLGLTVLACSTGCYSGGRPMASWQSWTSPLSQTSKQRQSTMAKMPNGESGTIRQTATRTDGAEIRTTTAKPVVQQSSFSSGQQGLMVTNDDLLGVDQRAPEWLLPEIGSRSLTLNEMIALCIANDPALAVGMQEIQIAIAEQCTASLKPNPELEIIQSLLPLGRPFEADVREGGPPQLDIMLAYPMDWYWFGKRAAAMRAAFQGRLATEQEYADLVRKRVLEVSLAFYDILEQQGLLELAQLDVENLREVERITQVAVENGALPSVELNRIRLDRLGSEQTLRETKRDLRNAKAALLALIGSQDGNVAFEIIGELHDPIKSDLPPLEEIFQMALNSRPDIEALRTRVDEAAAIVEVEYREGFREITPMIGYTRQFQERAIGFPDVSSFAFGLSMTLPVNDRNQGNRQRASAEQRQRIEELRLGLVELRAELIEVTTELETARSNAISTAEDQLRLAEEVRDGIRQAYELGGRPLIDVLDSQRNFRETFRNYINSRADYWRAVHRYNAALAMQSIE